MDNCTDPVNDPGATVDRLLAAINTHNLDALADCFAVDYVNETPVHPARGFHSSDQARRNWALES
ncbi:nuclear transport factor 2 family protein [Streptomyces sp. NPDC001698]|uniref:nuclear transport factor 2 family protein n=1 Tax=Streptomyces sp. NPDC001698 TaxID=3364601 RepID=UPI0036794EF1